MHLLTLHLRTGVSVRHGAQCVHQPGLHLLAVHLRAGMLLRNDLTVHR